MNTNATSTNPVTVRTLAAMKASRQKIAMVTAYDASFAAQADAAGVDAVLVGDSLGMVVQGRPSTLPVTIEDIVYHSQCVGRGLGRALLIADMPFLSFRDVSTALASAGRLMAEGGAAMVKVEGAGRVCESIASLAESGIPVCAHLGLTPQSVHKFGGYRVRGRDADEANRLREDARAVAAAGADLLVLECVPDPLAAEITGHLAIPVIGIGAGPRCDGQVLVLYDLLGVTPGRRPRFSKDFLAGTGSVVQALSNYVAAVRGGEFPGPEHSYAS